MIVFAMSLAYCHCIFSSKSGINSSRATYSTNIIRAGTQVITTTAFQPQCFKKGRCQFFVLEPESETPLILEICMGFLLTKPETQGCFA
jgi:hypothetical protein